jgi:hypothetical protein
VTGNLIGTDSGRDLGNAADGVLTEGPGTLIGGNSSSGNVISGNQLNGVEISAKDVSVSGNTIGLSVGGVTAIPNSGNGISASVGTSIVIGGGQSDQQNVIGGDSLDGILVTGPGADGIVIQSNVIGRSSPGQGNGANGIELGTASTGTVSNAQIGGPPSDAGNPANAISGNGGDGVLIRNGTKNRVQNNSITGNGESGIDLARTTASLPTT